MRGASKGKSCAVLPRENHARTSELREILIKKIQRSSKESRFSEENETIGRSNFTSNVLKTRRPPHRRCSAPGFTHSPCLVSSAQVNLDSTAKYDRALFDRAKEQRDRLSSKSMSRTIRHPKSEQYQGLRQEQVIPFLGNNRTFRNEGRTSRTPVCPVKLTVLVR